MNRLQRDGDLWDNEPLYPDEVQMAFERFPTLYNYPNRCVGDLYYSWRLDRFGIDWEGTPSEAHIDEFIAYLQKEVE